jgi:tetratricopeptide (TPR) repeat protein
MSPDTLKKLRIFVASPSDVASERAKVETVAAALKPMADYLGLALEVSDWRKVVPDMGRPQQVIFDQLLPTSWDVFIGILWQRFGTPPSAIDQHRQMEYLSGTEEEFWAAYQLWQQFGRPRMMMYRCTRQVDLSAIDFDQARRVRDFFAQFEAKGEHPGLAQSFDTTEAFEKLLFDHLQKMLIEYGKQLRTPITPEVAQILTPKIPNNLPRRALFFGRQNEIAEAMRALNPDDRGWGVVIDGIGGIGKTALAIEIAYQCKEQGKFDAFVFVSAKRDRLEPLGIQEMTLATTTLDALVTECARTIGRQGIAQLAGSDKIRAFLDALRGMRTLLIIDNVETLTVQEQTAIGDFLRGLPVECKAIVTSRRRTDESAVTIRVDKLDWEAARELIKSEIERDAEMRRVLSRVGESAWKQLYDEAGGSPLALTWTIGLIRARCLRFENALALLRDGSAENDLNAFIYRQAQERMDTNERGTLGALSFFGGPATFAALSAVADLERRTLDVVLERLRALSLVDFREGAGEEERYALHPLTRRFANADLAKDAQAEHEIGMRFAQYWVEYAERYGGSSRNYATYTRVEAEWMNLDAAAHWLWEMSSPENGNVRDEVAGQMLNDLAESLSRFLWYSGHWDDRIELEGRAYEVTYAMNNWQGAGWRAYRVALIYHYRGHTGNAALWADKCSQAWSKTNSNYLDAISKRIQGLVAQQKQEYSIAEKLFNEALKIRRSLGTDRDTAISLNDLGMIRQEQTDYDLAEHYYLEAIELARKINGKWEQAEFIGNIGEIALARQQWDDARVRFQEQLSIAQDIVRVDLIANARYGLARVNEAEGHADLALPLAESALKIYERLQYKDLAKVRELTERLKEKMKAEG